MIHKAHEYRTDEILRLEANYNYQPELTRKLEQTEGDFTQEIINEIVLWKVNRCASLESELLQELNGLARLNPGEHRKGESVLRLLLKKETKGVDLPMASTLLRFKNPQVFQIIDRRAFRVLMKGDKYPLYTASSVEKKVETYFTYLDEVVRFCNERAIPFEKADQLLYQLDKEHNKDVSLY